MYVLKFEQETANLKLLTQRSNDELHTFKVKFEHASQEIDVLKNLKSSLISQNEAKDDEICALKTEIEEKDSLNRTLDQKFSKLMEDTRHLHHEMELIEREHNALKYEITEKNQAIDALELLRGELEHKCLCHQEEAESNKSSALKFENESKRLDSILMEANAQLHDLKSQSKEKDSIISGDTQKLAELNAQVNAQKKMISDLKAEVLRTNTGHEHSEAELIHEVETLKAQIFAAQQKSDERIQEIAEQLYHQYSKKHEVKVGQLRKNYEFKIKEMKEVSEESEKRIENLESQLQIEVKEKDYLLSVLEKVKENA
ncbi:hypothetical protein METBIDRAFT_39749 [Metschnikowia bicuspidata var. bicuspidata NRRL YB-4993]|uniref:Uncharacterized protein n=1 Tax=Metschnikowia bicuspidata var. bicuspidata NRRL YB-4993 TaxID=869754 RepID=A0A1A0HDX7_9ASCO|nr:hypothetical protein METBIDRAFT_39749 [Metschnikowia bicuspidata var. bicuspidata NRRL YB-4993]OBA22216.1 hypothetical protein METBIDRAFT_39749 [Metschnikowia bicuspidata var. bicuspidata NRRL YB-4993]